MADLAEHARPVSEENFKNYGASTTPTLVLIDRQGLVRMYHPGQMPYEELAPRIEAVLLRGVRAPVDDPTAGSLQYRCKVQRRPHEIYRPD